MAFSRLEYWSGLPLPSPGNLLDPGIKPGAPSLQANSLPSEPPGKPKQSIKIGNYYRVTSPKGLHSNVITVLNSADDRV